MVGGQEMEKSNSQMKSNSTLIQMWREIVTANLKLGFKDLKELHEA